MQGRKNQRGGSRKYSHGFRVLVAREYIDGNLSYLQVAEKFELPSRTTVKEWVKWYKKNSGFEEVSLPPMTEEEKREKSALEKRIKALEKQLENERLRNLALETLIDVAEEELEVDIRKKPGTKQSDD